MSGCNWEKKKN